MFRRGRGPARERGNALRMLRRSGIAMFRAGDRVLSGDRLLVKRIRVVEDVVWPDAALLQVGGQLLVFRPLVFSLLPFGGSPAEIHADESEPRRGDHVEVPFVSAREVDVYADAGGQH